MVPPLPDPVAAGRTVCSARGCRRDAVWALRWNNPRLHTPERRKVWLACEGHRDDLSGFLTIRGFLKDCIPLDELGEATAQGHS